MTLEKGDPAPTVSADNQDGESVTIDSTNPTVVYFYPRDATPGCTIEARQFELERDSYEEAGVAVYGVSTDDVDPHREFCDDEELSFDLLADSDGTIAEAFGVEVTNGIAARTTFLLADGQVERVYENVNPDGHARSVLGDALDDDIASFAD